MNPEETSPALSRKRFNRFLQDGNVNYRYDCYQCKREKSDSWLRRPLQAPALIAKTVILGAHRRHQERAPPPRFMPIQGGHIHLGILLNKLPQDRENWIYQIILDETLNL